MLPALPPRHNDEVTEVDAITGYESIVSLQHMSYVHDTQTSRC